ncbi:hypothetical protein WJX73_002065 [Symbiochloris irregularis]|uniref:Uncharacterized protein n=1 Tax=Symbiochloris irregularis TaxID=706552 RepID=A0AAW1PR35_9CHLO
MAFDGRLDCPLNNEGEICFDHVSRPSPSSRRKSKPAADQWAELPAVPAAHSAEQKKVVQGMQHAHLPDVGGNEDWLALASETELPPISTPSKPRQSRCQGSYKR